MGKRRDGIIIFIAAIVIIGAILLSPIHDSDFAGMAYAGFSDPISTYTFNTNSNTVSVSDSAVYKYGYYSVNGGDWQPFNLTGAVLGGNWLTGAATRSLPNFGVGEHYVVIYSCTYVNRQWDCHGNQWQIITVSNTQTTISCTGTQPTTGCSLTNGQGTRTVTCNTATGQWTTGTCTISSCNSNYGNCDGNSANGCETNLQTSTNNCGTCGSVCSGTCSTGQCTNPVSNDPITNTPKGSGTTYYVSASGNDGNTGLSESAAWQTLKNVNEKSFNAGDTILFRRGDTWYGSLTIKASGTSGKPITYGAYGTASGKPVITGLVTVTGWVSNGGGTYYKSVQAESSPLIVTVNGVNTPKGRWPNTGWLIFDSYSGYTSITDSDMNGRNFAGGEVVIRVARWITYRGSISSHSGSTINFPWALGGDYSLKSGQGYFIQNDIDTFDIVGDWSYNNGNLYMYFGSDSPSNYVVKTSTIDQLAYLDNKEYITFDNLVFEGANNHSIQVRNSRHITITNCIFQNMGGSGIYGPWWGDSSYMTVENCRFVDNNNCGINVQGDHEYATIRYNDFRNIGMIDGLAGIRDGSSIAIEAGGSNTLIERNTIDNTGYNGITFAGANTKVRNNYVNHFCQKKDDGSGIYTYEDSGVGKEITDNVVLNSIGHPEGMGGYLPDGQHESTYHEHDQVNGIYIDGSDNVLIVRNSIANTEGSGIFLNTQALNINVQNNMIFNHTLGMRIISNRGGGGEITNLTSLNNILVAADTEQRTMYYVTGSGDSAVRSLGNVNNNYYARPMDDTDSIQTQTSIWGGPTTYRTLASWQSYSGLDSNTKKSPKAVTSKSDIRFEYNPTSSSKTISLGGNYIDVKGTVYSGSVTLAPYSSVILLKN